MAEHRRREVIDARANWIASGSTTPLLVEKHHVWSVIWRANVYIGNVIAEFDTWQEAMDWVQSTLKHPHEQERCCLPCGTHVRRPLPHRGCILR